MLSVRLASPDRPDLPGFDSSALLSTAADEPQYLKRQSSSVWETVSSDSWTRRLKIGPNVEMEAGSAQTAAASAGGKHVGSFGQPEKALALGGVEAVDLMIEVEGLL
jgi:hypothetical protein